MYSQNTHDPKKIYCALLLENLKIDIFVIEIYITKQPI